jgi:hypothetical protein
MELIEMIDWIALGFLPVFVGLEIISIKLGVMRSRPENGFEDLHLVMEEL